MVVGLPRCATHRHGHHTRAADVSVVSRQFDRVRVEQNHCQGLQMVKANCARGLVGVRVTLGFGSTYACPRCSAPSPVGMLGQTPRKIIDQGGKRCLRDFWRGNEQVGPERGRQAAGVGQPGAEGQHGSKEGRVQRRAQLVLPLLGNGISCV